MIGQAVAIAAMAAQLLLGSLGYVQSDSDPMFYALPGIGVGPFWVENRWKQAVYDREWGVPVHDDHKHFEFLVLEGAQAGLSWAIILKKREGYRRAFDGFDPKKVARFSVRRIEKLVLNSEIIRNRIKIEAAVRNARVSQSPERVRKLRLLLLAFR